MIDGEENALSAAVPGGGWRLWRSVLLRGAGFPAREVLRLASPSLAAAADRLLDLEDHVASLRAEALREVNDVLDRLRQEGRWDDKEQRRPLLKAVQALTAGKLPADVPHPAAASAISALCAGDASRLACQRDAEALLESESSRLSREIADIAASPSFREAVIWQNPNAASTALDMLRRETNGKRGSQQRQHEQLVASYLQRYCVKNDTIGFFGPVAHAWLSDAGDLITLEPGPALLQDRNVYFENWAIDALARHLAATPGMRPWLAPRLKSSYYLEGDTLHRSFGPPVRQPAFQARLLAACDGTRTARETAADLASCGFAEDVVFAQLDEWAKKHVIAWTLEVPLELHPLRTLERTLRRIADPALREPALAAVATLEAARGRVAAAAGNPDALHAAMASLDRTFSALTGVAPQRAHGMMYAARGVVYEDCRRDVRLRLGPELLERLGPPLSLVLDSARWLAGEMAAAVSKQLDALHARLCGPSGSGTVDSLPFFSQAVSSLMQPSGPDRFLTPVVADFRARWARLLEAPGSQGQRHLRFTNAELRARVAEVFGNPRPAWTLSRYLCPDIMICASGAEAFQRGDFTPVLGEVHCGNTLLSSCFVSQHPEPEELRRATGLPRTEEPNLLPHYLKYNTTQRMNLGLVPLRSYYYAVGDDAAPADEVSILAAGAVVIAREDGRLVARSRDCSLKFNAIDLLGIQLSYECSDVLGTLLPPAAYQPRISIDDLVVSRERWVLNPATVGSAHARKTEDRFVGLRRWARELGLPRFCFYKIKSERKPCFLDLDSPVLVEIFAKMIRAAAEQGSGLTLTITEMQPSMDQLWLVDSSGSRYTSELRVAAFRP